MVPDGGGGGVDGPGRDEEPADGDTETAATAGLPLSRRALLGGAALAGVGVAGGAALLGGNGDGDGDADRPTTDTTRPPDGTPPETTPVAGDEARRLAEAFAPTFYFGRRERWFPTDPRPYTSEVDGETVVRGFDALDGYAAAKAGSDTPAPDPTVFYHVLTYTDRLAVVQYWVYSAFDQFSVNFHWHDWELLQVFVDRDIEEPALYAASAHSRTVPNNEFLDPPRAPAVISEVGSHSSALGVNDQRDTFQRVSIDGLSADVTNGVLSTLTDEAAIPFAYGLPRDEGLRLPYVVPELDGAPVTDHPELPNVSAADLVPAELTVRSFTDLARPPTGLPLREPGPVFGPDGRDDGGDGDAAVDETYALVPTAELEEIAAFTGPQLSFEFLVPQFAEDAISSHITTTSTPWDQPRYDDPLADVTDDDHRAAIAERFGLAPGDRGETVVGQVQTVAPADGVEDGVTLSAPPVELVAQLASDPVAVPTFGGTVAFVDVDPGEHTLTVNGPGYAPYAQRIQVGDAGGEASTTTEAATATATTGEPTPDAPEGGTRPARLGSDGRIGLVPNEDAVKLAVDATDRGGARRVRVDDDRAGRVYDARPAESDGRAGVYVHRAGGYVVEVTDERGETSVERVNPGPNQEAAEVANARTGVAGVTRFLVDYLTETRATVERLLRRGGARPADPEDDQSESESAESTPRGDDAAESTPTEAPSDGTAEADDDESEKTATGENAEDEDADDTSTSTATGTRTATSTATGTRTATPTATETRTPTATPAADAPVIVGSIAERLRQLFDTAVAQAEAANAAAVDGDRAATETALRELRETLATIAALVEEDAVPQPAGRVAGRRIETADRRAARALGEEDAE
ncbi:hypothetical protein [Salinigranum marinum]|uniref:hypothetical protein n=1 Tax=Salinigranum marinum TaxID=1515595 RepID=UPI002989C373|nr:hypothetical protein [Salinigranum marinum]